jgi:hypothetical protein
MFKFVFLQEISSYDLFLEQQQLIYFIALPVFFFNVNSLSHLNIKYLPGNVLFLCSVSFEATLRYTALF